MVQTFKVVSGTARRLQFRSYYNANPLALSYVMQETTKSETPIFVFQTLIHVARFVPPISSDTVVEGESSELFHLPRPFVLTSNYLGGAVIGQFWKDMFTLDTPTFRAKYTRMLVAAPEGTMLTYDFTPRHVLPKHDVLTAL